MYNYVEGIDDEDDMIPYMDVGDAISSLNDPRFDEYYWGNKKKIRDLICPCRYKSELNIDQILKYSDYERSANCKGLHLEPVPIWEVDENGNEYKDYFKKDLFMHEFRYYVIRNIGGINYIVGWKNENNAETSKSELSSNDITYFANNSMSFKPTYNLYAAEEIIDAYVEESIRHYPRVYGVIWIPEEMSDVKQYVINAHTAEIHAYAEMHELEVAKICICEGGNLANTLATHIQNACPAAFFRSEDTDIIYIPYVEAYKRLLNCNSSKIIIHDAINMAFSTETFNVDTLLPF